MAEISFLKHGNYTVMYAKHLSPRTQEDTNSLDHKLTIIPNFSPVLVCKHMRQTIQVNDNTVAGRAGQKIAALVYGIPWGISSNMLSPSSVLTAPEFSKAMVDGGRTVGGRGGVVASVDAVPLACEVARGPVSVGPEHLSGGATEVGTSG